MGLFDNINLEEISSKAAEETDEQLKNKISSLTRMTDKEIQELFPRNEDAKKLVELIEIVNESTTIENKKLNIVQNIENLSETVIKVIEKFV